MLAAGFFGAAPAGAQSSTVSFSASKAAPGTQITATPNDSTASLSCVNQVTVSTPGSSSGATIDSNQGTKLVFTTPNVAAGQGTVTLDSSSQPTTCAYSGSFQVAPTLSITTMSLADGGVGVGYYFRVRASGGVGPYSWTVTTGAVPAGVVLNSNGIFTGTPASSGSFAMTITVSDNNGLTSSAEFTMTVEPPPTVTVTTLPVATVGRVYSAVLSATGGVPPYTWSVGPGGGLPGGLVVNSAGRLSGVPGTAGTSMLDLQVTDSVGVSESATVPITVEPVPEVFAIALKDGALEVARPPNGISSLKVQRAQGGVVALAARANGEGFWALTRTGAVRGIDGAPSLGSVRRHRHRGRPVAIAASPHGNGYWVLMSDGRVEAFGDVRRQHVTGRPVSERVAIGIAPSPSGDGYWVLWSHGIVEAFGDAPVLGSVDQPHRAFAGIAAMAGEDGYWILAANGRVFPFGEAWREPVAAGVRLHGTMAGIASAPDGAGYWVVSRTGAIRAFGTARLPTNEPNPIRGARAIAIAASG